MREKVTEGENMWINTFIRYSNNIYTTMQDMIQLSNT